MDVKSAAAALGVGKSTIYNWVRFKMIACHRLPSAPGKRGKVTFKQKDLDEFMEAHRQEAEAELADD